MTTCSMDNQDDQGEAMDRLVGLRNAIRQGIQGGTFRLPLYTWSKVFSLSKLKYEDEARNQMVLNAGNVRSITRLLQIIEILRGLLEKGEFITKRTLYYKLVHYYQNYATVDNDLDLLAISLKLPRERLGVVSSSRCICLGKFVAVVDGQQFESPSSRVTNLPSFRQIRLVRPVRIRTVVIVEKESAMCQLQQWVGKLAQREKADWMNHTLMISSKGYPDRTTRRYLEQILADAERVLYLGDNDIYGADILFCYAIGYQQFTSWVTKIDWIDLSHTVKSQKVAKESIVQSRDDRFKAREILTRDYFKMEQFIPAGNEDYLEKLSKWKERLLDMVDSGQKNELEGYFKYLSEEWLFQLLSE